MSTIIETSRTDSDARSGILWRLPWREIIWTVGILLALAVFLAVYYKSTFQGLSDRYGMDISQIARQVMTRHSYTTLILRPLNVALVDNPDFQSLELNTAPLFPCAVAAVYWRNGAASDQAATWVSLLFLLGMTAATYVLGRVLFDWKVGLLAATAVGLSEAVIKAGTSGTQWTMAGFWLTLLMLTIVMHHRSVSRRAGLAASAYAAASALLVALMFMTAHVLIVTLLPLAVYFAVNWRRRRLDLVAFVLVAVIATAPWAYRNAKWTRGCIIGATAWDIMADTKAYPGERIYRTTDDAALDPMRCLMFPIERFSSFSSKLMARSGDLGKGLFGVAGLAIFPFAFVSMLYRFRSDSANLLRGLAYGVVPMLLGVFTVFSVDARALVMLAPLIAIFGTAYLLLLLDARRLHIVYVRMLIGGVIMITVWPALSTVLWHYDGQRRGDVLNANEYFVSLADANFHGLVYTDVPWIAALRLGSPAVWLPASDEGISLMASAGAPMQVVILTSECDNYPTNEAWYLIHRSKLWRDYVRDSNECIKSFVERSRPPKEFAEKFTRYMRERKRSLSAAGSLNGFAERDPGAVRVLPGGSVGAMPDDIVVLTGDLSR